MVESAKLRRLSSSIMIRRRWVTGCSSSATQTTSDHLDRRLSNTRMRPPHSGFVQVGKPEAIRPRWRDSSCEGRLVGSDLRAWHRLWTDYGLPGIDVAVLGADPTLSPHSRQSGCRLVKRFRLSVNSLREPKRQEKRLSWASRKTVPLNYHSGHDNPQWA